ncbi:hypothetical protein HPB49_003499 [Dermacentor silvarum]|uniref:Uncharacterized protein n=1 Tax=Dermacentor silvarum TaxID=543639 RepID=A0ACB8CP54_DERSI|nr:hypothetical protein HPB49_003499 [Dermacentor silvarum]
MAPPGETGGRPRTATAIVADTQVGYDPHSMMWTTVPSKDSTPELSYLLPNSRAACAALRGPAAGEEAALWQPQRLPKPKATDFVVVLKPREQLSLATIFPENSAGRALIAHLGATATRLVTGVMVRERNLILTHASNPQIEHELIGEFAVPSPVGPVPLFGYLRADN